MNDLINQTNNHIKQMLAYDQRFENETKSEANAQVQRISSVVSYFIARNQGNLATTMQQAPSNADIAFFKSFLNDLPSNLPSDLAKRVKFYKQIASIDKQHLLNAAIGLVATDIVLHRRAKINDILSDDYKSEVNRLAHTYNATVKLSTSNVKTLDVVNQPFAGAVWTTRMNKHADIATRLANNAIDKEMLKPKPDLGKIDEQVTRVLNGWANATTNIQQSESARVIGVAQMGMFKALGATRLGVITQPNACQFCLGIAAQAPYTPDNAPTLPFHSRCRCDFIYLDNNTADYADLNDF